MRTKVLRNVTWGFLLALMAACTPTNDTAILVERESNFTMEETLERIQNAAGELGYTVPIVHDMQGNMARNGIEVLPAQIMELCHGARAYEILKSDKDRYNQAMLPCRVAVYEKEDGKTYVSWTNYAHFSQLEHGISMEVFRQVGSDYDEIMQGIVKE